ncbi:hypothetical protein ACM614_26910, partial [Streptomyces sp. 12297]
RTAELPIVTRPCAYCPKSGADVCVRTHPASDDGAAPHLYAHRACEGAERGRIRRVRRPVLSP